MKLFMTSESILAGERSTTFFAHERLGSGIFYIIQSAVNAFKYAENNVNHVIE
jgi:hypothetical protein